MIVTFPNGVKLSMPDGTRFYTVPDTEEVHAHRLTPGRYEIQRDFDGIFRATRPGTRLPLPKFTAEHPISPNLLLDKLNGWEATDRAQIRVEARALQTIEGAKLQAFESCFTKACRRLAELGYQIWLRHEPISRDMIVDILPPAAGVTTP